MESWGVVFSWGSSAPCQHLRPGILYSRFLRVQTPFRPSPSLEEGVGGGSGAIDADVDMTTDETDDMTMLMMRVDGGRIATVVLAAIDTDTTMLTGDGNGVAMAMLQGGVAVALLES